ncbi:anti-phage dCTP deaminase [Brevundimonas sp.]|uniref:anti-phage dCTP deaminase n=1 Tax=Brevundimonas sp. TaxID=1871086 RepID=UPI0028ADF0DB|nr:anti-phage dCTP deaminase [Brevundimonas sp.]
MATAPKIRTPIAANSMESDVESIAPLSKELVVGIVGYAGAGCSAAAKRLVTLLGSMGYSAQRIRMSELISLASKVAMPAPTEGAEEGAARLARAVQLQDMGDMLRSKNGNFAVAALAVRRIQKLRGSASVGEGKMAFVIDSIKHRDEVEFLRKIYDQSFRLIAVHAERQVRSSRIIGKTTSGAKFAGASEVEAKTFMDRDEKDGKSDNGQQVREAFYLADYFVNNNSKDLEASVSDDLDRFANLILGSGLVRPTKSERAMYHAQAAALQSSCLSRQVGAALISKGGEVIGTGTNEVPAFGGGVYSEEKKEDNRCHAWKWSDGNVVFVGCHNDRKKANVRDKVASWLAEKLTPEVALAAHPAPINGLDTAKAARDAATPRVRDAIAKSRDILDDLPGVKDIIEYSRAIHAEMDAVLSAARSGASPVGVTLYCTTYPCHNCARHLVSAGVERVYFIEPYVKSLATDLHSDSITNELPAKGVTPNKMVVVPFTGVGPRMYEDFFAKRVKLKGVGGSYITPKASVPGFAVRLLELEKVEEAASKLVPEADNV